MLVWAKTILCSQKSQVSSHLNAVTATEKLFLLSQKANPNNKKIFCYFFTRRLAGFFFFCLLFCDIIKHTEMRKFLTCFFVGLICVADSFAAGAAISRTIPTKNATDTVEQKTETPTKNRSARNDSNNTISRTVSRDMPVANNKTTVNVVSRSVNNRKNTGVRATLSDGVNTIGRSARTESASINNAPSLRRAGVTLRASTAEVGGRATIGNTGVQTGSNIDEQVRSVQSRASIFSNKKQTQVTAESLANAKDIMEKTSDLNNTCQAQYNECMDQFCAVVDANQKRCSCSANLAKYAKAQKAVEDANAELNDVAQRIRYVGLSADEIRAIMSATEAELEMGKTTDSTQTRSMLDDIAEMIKDPTSSTTLTGTTSVDSLLDMDFDFSSDSSDIFSLDLFTQNGGDISSKRGRALYNEAKKRCKTVLNRCKDAGGTEEQISGNYDLAIDKDCVAYEQGLTKLNETLKNNVRSANLMLQKARLAVLQNKNQYDIRGCIGALENCMLDDMVCGANYEKCIDPTKRYIDENGKVILGRNIANITAFMENYDNSNINGDFIKASVNNTTCDAGDGACIVNYLLTKIGTGATAKSGGLCRAVLDKCQDYTYTQNGKTSTYNPYNEVVVNYIQRAMVNIKSAQSKIISNYASSCLNDVQDCYNEQNSQITSWSSAAAIDNIYKVLTGTCHNVALTCGYAVFAYDTEMGEKIDALTTEAEKQKALVDGISQMFYQTLLCPENSEFVTEATAGMVNERCACKAGYSVSDGACVAGCPTDKPYDLFGNCVASCPDGLVQDSTRHKCLFDVNEGYTRFAVQGFNTDPDVGEVDTNIYICAQGNDMNTSLATCQIVNDMPPEFNFGVTFPYGTIYGTVLINETSNGSLNHNNPSRYYCWSRITQFRANNGVIYNLEAPWYYAIEMGNDNEDTVECGVFGMYKGLHDATSRLTTFGKYGTTNNN